MTGKVDTILLAKIFKLLKYSANIDQFTEKLEAFKEKFGDAVYPALLFTTAHLEYSERTAKKHCKEILKRWSEAQKNINRGIDIRVILLDYFIAVNKKIKNPKIIEIKLFEQTQKETFVDELTQLYNYRYFKRALDVEIARANRYKSPLTLVIFDVDDFKNYNDTNGHLAGNKALKQLAGIISDTVRNIDVAARFGGEEFSLLLPETTKDGALVIADRIRCEVEKISFFNEKKQPMKNFTISGGLATLNVDAVSATDLINKADKALYKSKTLGKNRLTSYVEERRDFERVSAKAKGHIIFGKDSEEMVSVLNVSEGGVLFSFKRIIPLGTKLDMSLKIPGSKTKVHCQAKVKRTEELEENRLYEIGVRNVKLSKEGRKIIRDFLIAEAQKCSN